MRLLQLTTILTLLPALANAPAALAGPLERVPEDGSLATAIQSVSDHGTIDIAPGTYTVPSGGLRVRNKSVTLSARGGGPVILDGQDSTILFRVESRGVGTGDTVAFEGITFRNGMSSETTRAGAVTVDGVNAVFVSCVFDSNAAAGPTLRGGALLVRNASHVRVVGSRFVDNTAGQWGAGIFAIEGSKVHVLWSEFTGNRTDLPSQGPGPAGAAIYLLDSEAHIRNSHFEDNRSGWVGGAIYALGTYKNPASRPSALIDIAGSTFIGNQALPNPCCNVPGPPAGGAIHVENQATVRVRDSRLYENVSNFGGAISAFRAQIEIHDSELRGNLAVPFNGVAAIGGAVNVTSSEIPDPSNNNGAVNRPPGSLLVTDSFIQGRFGSTGVAAEQGACVLAIGDGNAFEGLGGMPQLGTAEDNRAPVVLDNVILADCDTETGAESNALGGAVMVNLADVTITDSVVVGSDALGDMGSGGAVASLGDSVVRARGSAFARNSAEVRGGSWLMSGGRVEIEDCLFLENDVSPGEAEEPQNATGAALAFAPSNTLEMTGFVSDSVFTGNVGLPILDIDFNEVGRFNDVVYNGNAIHSTASGDLVYKKQTPGEPVTLLNVAGLNSFTIARPGGSTTDKSEVDNSFLANAPRDGRIVAAPSRVLTTSAPGNAAPTSSFLGYAWSGGSSSVNNETLPDKVGFLEVDEPGNYRQRIDGQNFTTVNVGLEGCSGDGTLCLNDERFFVEVDFRDFNENVGAATMVPGLSTDSGLFFFFSEDNWEMLVKVLDGCSITDHFWVFAAATTNVEYTLRVTDKVTGTTKSYFNPLGNAAEAITDTAALDVCDAKLDDNLRTVDALPLGGEGRGEGNEIAKQTSCSDTATEMCLNQSRFRVEVDWRDFNGNTGRGQAVDFRSDDSGLFFFFTEENLEMLVKVLDGCGITNHFWVFAAATTNVEYTLTVTDTETGTSKRYFNRLGNAAAAITDTAALAVCPGN